jgi:hypothetical protein
MKPWSEIKTVKRPNLEVINQEVEAREFRTIRSLNDFQLDEFIAELHDHGWPSARKALPLIARRHPIPQVHDEDIADSELRIIRTLSDFDLRMLISEIHDHGWQQARKLLPMMVKTQDESDYGKAYPARSK